MVVRVSIKEDFADFLRQFPACSVVAFADLSTGMILAADTRERLAQEKLDSLCNSALQALTGRVSTAIAKAGAQKGEQAVNKCAVGYKDRLECYIRAPASADEALCLVLATDCDLASVILAGERLLQRTLVDI